VARLERRRFHPAAGERSAPGRKTDVNDATWLADLLAHDLIRGSFVPGEQTREMRTFHSRCSSNAAQLTKA
jgi:hypothetical protein